MRKLFAALVLGVVLATAGTSGQQPPPFLPYGALPVLEAYLDSLRQQAGIPGMSAALVREGTIVWERGFGFANVATRVRATPDTPYLIGDVSGTVAAVLLLQCVDHRRLELDEPLAREGLTLSEPGVTLRQLLSHTNGEGLGEPFAYNPERYAQLTAVMEWCAPQPYRKSVAHRVLNRLAMQDSVPGTDLVDPDLPIPEGLFDPDDLDRYRRILTRMAPTYKVDSRGRAERVDLPPARISATSGLVSTVRDLAKLEAALDSTRILSNEMRAEAWTPTIDRRGLPAPMGLGWFVQPYQGERIVWHFGHIPNASSSLVLKLPSRKLSLILLANSDGLSAPFQLTSGDATRSIFASLFLRLFA